MAFGKNTDEDDLDSAKGDQDVSNRSEDEIEGRKAAEGDEGGERDADDTGDDADPARAVVGLKKRLAKLTAQRNEARSKAQERDALATELADYKRKERESAERRKAAERATPEGQQAEAEAQAVRARIDQVYGPGTSDFLASRSESQSVEREAYAHNGVSYLKAELEDHGIVADNTMLVRWERAVGSELAEDEALLKAFRRPATQQAAIAEAFNRVRDGLANPVLKMQGAKPLARIERNRQAVLGGGRGNGPIAEIPEPTFDLKPPKELRGRELDQWWTDQRDAMWKRISTGDNA